MSKTILTVHSSDTSPRINWTISDIDTRDRKAGFAKCGYHFVICRDGLIQGGRGVEEVSVHDDLNEAKQALSVCLIGGVDKDGTPDLSTFTADQIASLNGLRRTLRVNEQRIKTAAWPKPGFHFEATSN